VLEDASSSSFCSSTSNCAICRSSATQAEKLQPQQQTHTAAQHGTTSNHTLFPFSVVGKTQAGATSFKFLWPSVKDKTMSSNLSSLYITLEKEIEYSMNFLLQDVLKSKMMCELDSPHIALRRYDCIATERV
jgi:hypothetical protein